MSTIAEIRRNKHLDSLVRTSDGKVQSLREMIDGMLASGDAARLKFAHVTGRKVQGLYQIKRPVWTLWVGDYGVDISKIGAEYAASQMNPRPDLNLLEEQGNAAYEKALKDSR
jgi:hypothetical protein